MIPRLLTEPRLIRIAALLVLLPFGPAGAWSQPADDTMLRAERMQVEHRDPTGLLPALRTLIGQRGSIGAVGDWLIVAAPGNVRSRVRQQLDELDTPVSTVRIQLEFPVDSEAEEQPAGTAGDTAPAPPLRRELEADIGQTITLNLPVEAEENDAGSAADSDSGEPEQLSLRVDLEGRRMLLSWRINPGEESAGPAAEQQVVVAAGDWRTLLRGIRVRLDPLD